MATVAKEKSALAQRVPKKQVAVQVDAPSRREFLYYIWGASLVMVLGQTTAGIVWFSLPRFKEGEFGGIFRLPVSDVPDVDAAPLNVPVGRFWVSNSSDGFLALYSVCTHLGCLPKWQAATNRFECPCHGSKFELNGDYIEGPAPRGLDRFVTTITFTNGDIETNRADGAPIPLLGRTIAEIAIDTGDRVDGA